MSLLPGATGPFESPSRCFWEDMGPFEHAVQIYHTREVLLDTIEGFVAGGLQAAEAVIVIATPQHLSALEDRLRQRGVSLDIARAEDQYIPLDAQEMMAKFVVGGWPDGALLENLLREFLARARGGDRRVRVFGEMVALMWTLGLHGATIRLEQLWHQICRKEQFPLLCAYPRTGFDRDADESIRQICEAHSMVLSADCAG